MFIFGLIYFLFSRLEFKSDRAKDSFENRKSFEKEAENSLNLQLTITVEILDVVL